MKDNRGFGMAEVILILSILIALVLIFKGRIAMAFVRLLMSAG